MLLLPLPSSAPLRRLPRLLALLPPLLLLIATSTCDGGSGDAQKEATIALTEAASRDDVPPTGLEPAAVEGGGHEAAEASLAAAEEAATKAETRRGGGGRSVEARRRGGATAVEASTAVGRGRRRHADYSTRAPQWSRPQPHAQPHTMSQSLYDHFRPLDPELPSGDILPFLQFGMKLPAVPSRVKTVHQPSSTTPSPPRSTTFPSASTNALTEDREEADNEMAEIEEDPQTRAQAHSTRATSKLKAAILLQMMVNNVRRKKLALRGNLRSKDVSKEGVKEGADGSKEEGERGRERVGEWGVRMGLERVRDGLERVKEEGEVDEREIAKEGRKEEAEVEGAEREGDEEEDDDGAAPNTKRRVVLVSRRRKKTNEDGEEDTYAANVDGESSSSDLSSDVLQNDAPVYEAVTEENNSFQVPPEIEEKEWKVAPAPKIPSKEEQLDEMLSSVTKFESLPQVTSVPTTSTTVLLEMRKPPATSTTPFPTSITTSTTPSTPPIPPSSLPSIPPTSMSTTSTTPSMTVTTPSPTTPSMTITTSPSTTTTMNSSTTIELTTPTTSPSTTTVSTPSTTIKLTSSTTSPSTTTVSTPSNTTQSTTPTTSSSTTTTTSSTMTPSTTPTTSPSTTTITTTTVTSSSTQSTTTTTSSSTPSSPSTSTPTNTTTSHRISYKPRQPHYPTLVSSQSIPSAPPLNSTRSPTHRHPLFPREHHRSPHVIFVPPSLRPPLPRRTMPPSSSTTPAKKTSPTTTSAPSSMPLPKDELPVKAELDARDWVAVPPPNTTSSPSAHPRTTHKSPPPNPPPTKPHPNWVEKGWQRPSHPSPAASPHTFQPFIPIEHHFSIPWQPSSSPYEPHPTPHNPSSQPAPTVSTTTGREVLSVVTSVSVESSPKLYPVSSTTASKVSIPPQTQGNNLLEAEHPSITEDPLNEIASESYPSQFPQLVSVFVEENNDIDNKLGIDAEQGVDTDPDVVAEPGMGTAATYILLSLAIVPGVVALASATRCLLLHRQKNLYESETSSEVSCMGGRTLKACSRGSNINNSMAAEESGTMRAGSDVFRVITRLPRVAHLGWEHERRRQRGKGGRADGGMLEGEEGPAREEDHSTKESVEIESWEFPRSKLRLQTLLGQGNFGQVWKAEADGICDGEGSTRLVAVKLVKVKEADEEEDVAAIEGPLSPSCTITQSPMTTMRRHGDHLTPMEQCRRKRREEFMAELGIMQLLAPPHPNVVTLLGCCTTTEPPLLIMEYVMFGKLLTFLREHRCKRRYANISDDPEILTSRDLLVFAYCVIKGMEYLVSKGVVHRDLAARNILVDHNKTCKIADFGMSRCVRDTGGQVYEEKQKQGALPVRWMAPESLFRGIFTHKSDVWSFGVLLWEIITLGSTPYPGIGARDVMRRVRDGRRLERPSHVRPEIFRVAARCWHRDPSLRPTFSRLRADMGPLLASASAGISRGSGAVDNEMCLVSGRGNRRWRPPGPQIDLNQFEDDSG